MGITRVPDNYKIPGPNTQIDPSQAGTPTSLKWILLAGHLIAAGSATPNQVIACGTNADADLLFGAGSMLARMFKTTFKGVTSVPIYCLPVPAPAAGVAATGSITVTAAPTVAGTYPLYIAGQLVPIGIVSADTPVTVAAKIVAAIAATPDLPVTAAVDGTTASKVNLTCKWAGLSGNDVNIQDCYLGRYGGEQLPAGLAVTYPTGGQLSGGTGTPDFTSAIAGLGDAPYKFVGLPVNDSGSYAVWDQEYGFTDSGRWGPYRQSYGQIFSARRGAYADQATWGPSNNSALISTMGFEPQSPSPVWEWAAAYTAAAAFSINAYAAQPLQTLPLIGVLPAQKAYRWNKTQLNALAQVGIAIQGTDLYGGSTNIPTILREQSNYQKNVYGQADNAYELVTTLATLDERYTRVRQALTDKFPRCALANDGTKFGAGKPIVTPLMIKAEMVSEYRDMETDGLVENADLYIANLSVARSNTEPNTVEILDPPDIVNQLRRLNILAQFRLQFPLSATAS
ncbi:phage tail sheath subtilisin-like domain-containing protein [Methylobacterium sp. J-070]|uniref:phage tail sheath subtilisin-like domain-containing protein n=1 Tax=Methylobacterium sp. J-070 TaxID=2836650 RepID=UPI001FBB40BA|nr:phage tail sheath subtilisin-like domain-containing protein [Methylobacterium sp. J-070]MCJ2053995.1 phage tail sheath subtilisin-like domain-containing protein [Methylobacterium sp. J-070]